MSSLFKAPIRVSHATHDMSITSCIEHSRAHLVTFTNICYVPHEARPSYCWLLELFNDRAEGTVI
jgi:hypothetical protein